MTAPASSFSHSNQGFPQMTEAQIKSLTEGEPLTVRPVMGTVATQEERHDYPELGLRRFDGCDLLPLNVHARAKEDVKEAVWEASANLSGCGAHSFVGAINRPHVEQMLEQAWNKLVFGTSPQEKLTAQRRVNYLNRLIGMIDAHKGNRYTDIRVVENRRRLLAQSADCKEADALALWT
jgi:hypothetical protein